MANDYVALAIIAVLSITGGLYVLYQAKKYRRKQQSKWLADLVDKAIENSQRMEHDLEYRSEIAKANAIARGRPAIFAPTATLSAMLYCSLSCIIKTSFLFVTFHDRFTTFLSP